MKKNRVCIIKFFELTHILCYINCISIKKLGMYLNGDIYKSLIFIHGDVIRNLVIKSMLQYRNCFYQILTHLSYLFQIALSKINDLRDGCAVMLGDGWGMGLRDGWLVNWDRWDGRLGIGGL